jgi:hypothetical protein
MNTATKKIFVKLPIIALKTAITLMLVVFSTSLLASEAPPSVHQFNVTCPAPKLLPILDTSYHECNNGYANGSCEKFVETFRQLLPEYDCQRSFDGSHIVPAVWLAGNGALEDYVRLLWLLSSSKKKMYSDKYYKKATMEAKKLFGSAEFRRILDGALAEEYWRRSEQVGKELK